MQLHQLVLKLLLGFDAVLHRAVQIPFQAVVSVLTQETHHTRNVLRKAPDRAECKHGHPEECKQDGGNRKFILVEMMDYAESITAERVRRVIDGYGEGKNVVEGTGGSFTFCDLGEPLLLANGNLNEEVSVDKIKEYVYYMETKESMTMVSNGNPYFMGNSHSAAYYFYYEKDAITTLDHDFLATILEQADSYIIYADLCTIPAEELAKYNITLKKIPRDIAKL